MTKWALLCSGVVTLLLVVSLAVSAGSASPRPPMRPYAGIGLVFSVGQISAEGELLPLPLYEEPGLTRIGAVSGTTVTGIEWLFGNGVKPVPFIVTARRGEWLRILYDDAGHEGWVNPEVAGRFQGWDHFLKQQSCRMLPGLLPRYYSLLSTPGGTSLGTVQAKQQFRVLKRENDWVMVLSVPYRLGWIRWRDEDGRLLVGFQP